MAVAPHSRDGTENFALRSILAQFFLPLSEIELFRQPQFSLGHLRMRIMFASTATSIEQMRMPDPQAFFN